jgi:hypothetical protein
MVSRGLRMVYQGAVLATSWKVHAPEVIFDNFPTVPGDLKPSSHQDFTPLAPNSANGSLKMPKIPGEVAETSPYSGQIE